MGEVQRLVFDIGLNNGDDAAYYLHLGYRVIGVEANPLLAAKCAHRFAVEIADGRMEVVNVGILGKSGEFTFYRNLQDDGWSTFDAEFVKRRGGEWEEMKVTCLTTEELIERYGRPFFIKVDIEGADFQILETLNTSNVPAYISLEINPFDPFVERLVSLGYDSFKFVDGGTFRPAPPIFDHQVGWRLLRKIGVAFPAFYKAMCCLPQSFRFKREWNAPGKWSPDGYEFSSYSSGPFAEQSCGPWRNAHDAGQWFRKLKDDYSRAGKSNELWWDIHARHSSWLGLTTA